MKNSLLIFLGIGLYSCLTPTTDRCPTDFEIPSTSFPYQETYQLGDTLTFFSKFHREVYDHNTDKRYDLGELNWNFRLSANRIDIDSLDLNQNIREYFNVFANPIHNPTWFDFSGGASIVHLDEVINKDTLLVKIKLELKQAGIYAASVTPIFKEAQDEFPGKCRSQSFDVSITLNEGADNNAHLLSESPIEHYNTDIVRLIDKRFHKWGGYCFRVIE